MQLDDIERGFYYNQNIVLPLIVSSLKYSPLFGSTNRYESAGLGGLSRTSYVLLWPHQLMEYYSYAVRTLQLQFEFQLIDNF